MLEKEFTYYEKNRASLIKDYNGKHIVITGETILGAYDSEEEALIATLKDHELGTFLIQYISAEANDNLLMFTSRVCV